MPRKRKKPFLFKIALWGWRHPHQLLDRAMLLTIAAILMAALWPLGGFVAAGAGLAWGAWLTLLLLLLFGLWWFTADSPRSFSPWSLACLPWLGYLAVSWLFVSPAPWRAQLEFCLWAQASAVFFVACHIFRSKRDSVRLSTVLLINAFLAVVLGLYQYYIRPGWLPLGNVQHPMLVESASGVFATPAAFAGFLLLFFPLALSIAAQRRFSTPARIASGVLFVLLLSGIVISSSKWACMVAGLILVISPFMLFDSLRTRIKFWSYGVVLIGLIFGAVWFGNPILRARFQTAFENKAMLDPRSNSDAAWSMFSNAPVIGQGSGATVYTQTTAQAEGFPAINDLAHNGYAEYLAQYGVIGAALLFIPIACLFFATWKNWRAHPTQRMSAEARFRQLHHNIHGMAADAEQTPKRRRKRVRKGANRRDPAPLARVLLTGLLLGQLAFFVHLTFESHFAFSATVLSLVLLLVVGIGQMRPPSRRLSSRAYGILGFSIAYLSAGAIFALSLPVATAQSYYYEATARIATILAERPSMDEALDELAVAHDDLGFAVRLNPGHADAWEAMGRARVEQLEMAPFISIDYQDQAVDYLRKAISLQDDNWRYWVSLGRALDIYRAPEDEVEAAFRRAVELAPESALAWFHLGNILSANPSRRSEAMEAANRALELQPDYEAAESLRRRLLLMGVR